MYSFDSDMAAWKERVKPTRRTTVRSVSCCNGREGSRGFERTRRERSYRDGGSAGVCLERFRVGDFRREKLREKSGLTLSQKSLIWKEMVFPFVHVISPAFDESHVSLPKPLMICCKLTLLEIITLCLPRFSQTQQAHSPFSSHIVHKTDPYLHVGLPSLILLVHLFREEKTIKESDTLVSPMCHEFLPPSTPYIA